MTATQKVLDALIRIENWCRYTTINHPINQEMVSVDIENIRAALEAKAVPDALLRELATLRVKDVRGSVDVPGFDACVDAEYRKIKAAQEVK